MEFDIRNLKTEDLPQVKDMSDIEHWNYSLEFLEGCRKVTPEGFFVAVTKAGEVLGHCGAVLLGESHAKFMMFVTKPKWRGKGIGKQLLNKTLVFLGDRNIALDAMPGTDVMYKKVGFKVQSFEVRYTTVVPKSVTACLNESNGVTIVDASDICLQKVVAFDQTVSSLQRSNILKNIFEFSTKSSIAVKDGEVQGYGCSQRAVEGYAIGPIYANDPVIARMIWDNLIGQMDDNEDKKVSLNIFISNEASVSMFESCTIETRNPDMMKRMYTTEDVNCNYNKMFVTGDVEI